MKYLLEKRKEFLQITLGLISCVLIVALFLMSWIDSDARGMWVAAGLATILFILLSDRQGASVFLSVMLIGTLVAREEFILEASAIVRGEKIEKVRESRASSTQSLALTKLETQEFNNRLLKLISERSAEPAEKLKEEIIELGTSFNVAADAKKLSDSSRAWVRLLAAHSPVEDANNKLFDRYFGETDTVEGWKPLEIAGYVKQEMGENDLIYSLTDKGKFLASQLGYL